MFNFSLSDIIKLPVWGVYVVFVSSAIILFSPDIWLQHIYMYTFREQYGYIIGPTFIISFALILVRSIRWIGKYIINRYKVWKLTSREKLIELDQYKKAIVYALYSKSNHTLRLSLHDGAISFLQDRFIIVPVSSQCFIEGWDIENLNIPFVLQPWVVRLLEKDSSLLGSFKQAYDRDEFVISSHQRGLEFERSGTDL